MTTLMKTRAMIKVSCGKGTQTHFVIATETGQYASLRWQKSDLRMVKNKSLIPYANRTHKLIERDNNEIRKALKEIHDTLQSRIEADTEKSKLWQKRLEEFKELTGFQPKESSTCE